MLKDRRSKLSTFNLVLLAWVVIFQLLAPIASAVIPTDAGGQSGPAVVADTAQEALRKRILFTFIGCLNNSMIDTNIDYNKPSDIYAEYGHADGESIVKKVIVGLDRVDGDPAGSSNDGVVGCYAALRQGVREYASVEEIGTNPPDSDLDNWLMAKVTGGQNIATSGGNPIKKDKTRWDENLKNFKSEVESAYTALGPVSNAMIRARLLPLVELCYTMSSPDPIHTLGSNDFHVEGVGYFYLKAPNDIRAKVDYTKGGWVHWNDGTFSNSPPAIGNIDLDWPGHIYEPADSDMYPFGVDVPFPSDDQTKGILDCDDINPKKNSAAAFVYEDTKIQDGHLVDTVTGASSSSGGDLANLSEDDNSTCEVTPGSFLSWIICPIINGATTFVDWFFQNVVVPFLDRIPISTDPKESVYQIWSAFRILGNVILIGALLAIVIAQATGKE